MTPRAQPPSEKRSWHVDRGIPLAGILSVGMFLLAQTVGIIYKFSTMEFKVDQTVVQVDKANTKIDAINGTLQSGLAPSAVNTRRLEEAERDQATLQAQVNALRTEMIQALGRIAENERKLATTDARARAARER